jgi:tetratricopeptide (TPR) repeat protein
MRVRRIGFVAAGLGCFALVSLVAFGQAPQLGTIDFPTSGAPAAQPAFVEGVKDLHSFEFDEAAEAFRKAQQADPNFALAYWGEAMSYNHPLWAQVDVEAAKKALAKLAPGLDGRLAKARLPKEKAYLDAIDRLFFTEGDKLARDQAYSQAMARMYQQWPTDHEVATLYALSLLGTVRPGDKGFRRQALAASIVENVFKENPNHPGAAHFIIHSFDDPDHAPLALTAARAYAKIAPAAPHALHMPSHIFVQLGMWDDVATSNTVAYKAAGDLIARMHLPEGREDFHTLSWLQYANLMMGKFDEAKRNVELARQTSERNQGNAGIRDSYLGMRARQILETGQWEKISIDAAPTTSDDHTNMPGMAMGRYNGGATWTFIAGFSAAKLGDAGTADKAVDHLHAMAARAESGGNVYGAKPFAIMEREVAAIIRLGQGQKDEAVRLAKEAVDIELTMTGPSGPPDPIKPALELYADVLLDAGRAKDAAQAYEDELLRTPNRTPSLKGLSRAKEKIGMTTSAAR